MYKDNRLVESLYTPNVMNQTGYSDSSGRFMMNSFPMGTLLKGHAAQERPSPEGAGCSVCDSHSGPWTGLAGSLPTPYVHPRVHPKWSTVSPNGPGYNSINSTGTKRETRFDTGRLCKRCISHFNIFKREALKLITEERLSVKDPKVSMYLYESMKPPARTIDAWSNMDERCGVCSTHYSQLKQEAIRTILTQDQAIWTSSSSANTLSPRLRSRAPHCSQTLPRTSTHRSQSPDPRQMPTNTSPDYWNKGRQHFGTLWPLSSCKGSHSAPQKGPLLDEMEKQSLGSTALCNYSGSPPSRASSMSSLIPAGTSAALSYFVRAVQKLNGMVRRGRQFSESGSSSNLTNFSTVLLKSPPPVPASFLQAANKSKDIPGIGKVKVMLRVCSVPVSDPTPPHSYKLELRKKQITVLDLGDVRHHRLAGRAPVPTKTFNFDAAFGHDATQAEVCESSLSELLQWVLAGADGCVLSFGQTSEGMSHTMIGRDDCSLSLGVVPCAISWLFKLIHRKRDKTWANISVCVSAVEVCGETNAIRDLLSAVDTDSGEDCGPDASLREDPVCGIQLSKQRVLNAPTSERAAFLLDAALTARGGDVPHRSCHMFFNLHIRQQHIGNKSAMKVDQSKLSLIDLGSCVGDRDDSNCGVCLADLGNVITAKLNRHKHVSNRGSKLAMLLQDSLSNTNCATTIIAHISTSPRDVTESLCTMQTVSRIRKQQKKIRTQSSSSSPGGQSSGNERKVNTATKFRFKSTEALDQEISSGGFFAEPEFHPGLEKTSCETVLPMESSGILNKEVKNRSREVSPVIPSSLRSKLETKKISLMKLCEISPPIACRMKPILKEKTWEEPSTILQDEPNVECLKCNTFAELQNRLGNIDLDETDLYPTKDQAVKILIKPSNSSKSEEKSISAEAQVSRKGEAESARPKNAAKALAGVKSRNAIPNEANPQTLSHLGALRHNAGILSSSPSSGENQQNENMSLTLEDRDIYSDDSAKQPDTRLSPAGKSSPRSTSSSSFSSALSASLVSPLPASVIEEPQSQREMRATITVTVQQPIDLNGQDELVYTVVEEVTINGRHEKGKAKILSVHESRSLQSLAQENQPVRIIGSVGEEPTASFYSSQGNSQTLKNENSNENAPANTTNAQNSEHLDPKDLQQHEAWPDVPLTEDMKDALQEIDVIRTPASKIHEDLLSKQYACEITPNQSWLCQSQNSQNKEMIYKKAEHKHHHLESKQPQDGPGDCCKDLTPHSPSLKKKESTLSRSAAVKQKHLLTRSPSEDSSKLFNAKLKALSSRSQTLDQSKSSWSSAESLERNCSSPILKSRILQESACIDLPHKSLLDRDYFPACSSMSSSGVKEDFHDDLAMCPAIGSPGRVPRFFPIRDMETSDTTWPSKATCLEATGLTKLKPNPRINKASGAHPKNSIVTSKSTRRSINRSSSFSPSGACLSQSSWSTQSLSRTQESTRMSGRMDLLRYSRDSLSTLNQSQLDESDELVTQKPFAHTLASPYSQITAPRDPYHCSGHASDTTSVLSGDLPPAMCKTALLYNRSSVVSSGYESMLRDSEATISSSSTHNSISDHSCSAAAKGTRSLKKRSNMGSSPRRPSQEPGLTLKRSSSGPKVHRVDRNVSDSYEIKVYEIDNVDGLQKRSGAGNKGIVRFSAKLKFLEHRQQRIAEVRAKFTALKRELDVAKQHLMLDPGKWNRKFDLWQTFEVDSLEHLEALEQVTKRLQNHLHLCKTHILMVTCFDVADKRRQKYKHRPAVDLKGFVGI